MSSFFDTARKKAASAASSLPLVANVSSAFERFSTQTTSPHSDSVTGEFSQGRGEPFADPAQGSTIGEHVVCLVTTYVCGGMVGAGGKFCCKRKADCLIAKHDRDKFLELVPGFYIKAGTSEAYCSPVVDLSRFSLEAREHFLNLDFKTVSDIRRFFDKVNLSETRITTKREVEVASQKLGPAEYFTPGPKRLKKNDLREKFDFVMASTEEMKLRMDDKKFGVGEEDDASAAPTLLTTFLNELTTTVSENQMDAANSLEKVHDVMSQLGVPPKAAPPTLWLGYMEHASELADISNALGQKVDASVIPSFDGLAQRVNGIEHQFQDLYQKLESAFNNIESQLKSTFTQSSTRPGVGDSASQASKAELELVSKRVENLSTLISSLQNVDHNRVKSVRIGKFMFQTMDDLEAWMTTHLPPNYPFGAFVDVYSFLQRVKSNRDIVESGRSIVAGMEDRRKSKLTADESLVVEAFADSLPRCFNGPSSTDAANWLPGLKTKQKWETDSGMKGIKLAIKDNIEGIRSRLEAVISQRLGSSYPVATGLARELLSDTITFITALIGFISNTYQKLTNAGYPPNDAWALVSKLVYRMFATDCFHEKRGIATEMLDADNHKSLAVGILWSTFGTHMVMREYLKFDFADHPSISGEFTRFLVANAGVSKITKAEDTIKRLDKKVVDLEKLVATLDKKATSASNRADEAHKLAASKKNNASRE